MAKLDDSSADNNLLPEDEHRNYIVLPIYLPAINRQTIISAATILFLSTSVYILWPTYPHPSIVRLHLQHFHINSAPRLSLDITLDITVQIRNEGFYSLSYTKLEAFIAYRGKQLGFVTSASGLIIARGSSYVNATLELDNVEIFSDTIMLIEDLARGLVPLDTVTEVEGGLGFFFFHLPLKAKVSCQVDVNTHDQTVYRQNCYSKVG